MTNHSPTPATEITPEMPSPWRCFGGGIVAGGMAIALYFLTSHIAQSFAAKPIHSSNFTVVNLTVAVRTLVVGVSTLGTGVFGIAALGLIALGVQILIQKFKNPDSSSTK